MKITVMLPQFNIVELFIMNDISYWQPGSKFARAWQIGDESDAS